MTLDEFEKLKKECHLHAMTIKALRDVVTGDFESKAHFIARVRAILAADPDERVAREERNL